MSTWVAVLAVGAGSYAFRLLPLVLWRVTEPAPWFRTVLAQAGLAALTALAAGAVRRAVVDDAGAIIPWGAAMATGVVLARLRRPMLQVVAGGTAVAAALTVAASAI